MSDWQSGAVAITVLAATAWLLWGLVPRRQGSVSGCGSGCGSCPVAAGTNAEAPGGFVGLDVLQRSISTDAEPRDPVPTAGS